MMLCIQTLLVGFMYYNTVPEFSVRAGGNSNINTVLKGLLHTVHINSGKLSREKSLNFMINFLIGITTKRS